MRLFKRSPPTPPQLVKLAFYDEGVPASDSSGLRLSLPSCFSECNIDELMACSAAGTPKSRRGFPFPWLNRKHSAPKKYAVNPSPPDELGSPLRTAVSQLSLADYGHRAQRWPAKQPQPAFRGKAPAREAPDNPFASSESLNNNNYIHNNNVIAADASSMYRSVSTSALLEDPKEYFRSVEIDVSGKRDCFRKTTASCEALIDPCADVVALPPEGSGGGEAGCPLQKPAVSQLGTVLEEEVFLDRAGSGDQTSGRSGAQPAEDTESLASSIQHRSDESGYESDGTKNGSEDKSPDAEERPGKQSPDTNIQKFTALFQRLTSGADYKKDESGKSYEARSLRIRPPAVLSNFVQRHSGGGGASAKEQSKGSPEEPKKESRNGSRLGQFKAWTLDRKLLRSRWKKSSLPEDKLDIAVPTRRGSIFQSSLFPNSIEDTPPVLETKSLPTLSASAELLNEPSPDLSTLSPLSTCGGLNYQLRLKKAGYKSVSTNTNNARRRLWLQSQLSSSDSEDILSPEPLLANKNFVSSSCPGGADVPRRIPSQLEMHEIISVDLQKDEHGELGIYITGCHDAEKNVLGYIIVDFEKGGPADRSGKLLKGDELLIVNGHQLQGVGLDEARRLLRVPEAEVHLLIARELSEDLCFKEDASRLPISLPPVPELHESTVHAAPRLRHWQSTTKADNRHSHPDLPPKLKADNERMGSNGICTLPRRPKSSQLSLHTVVFEKGPGRKSLGFSIVGGKDSPKGELGFYVKTIFANGQAAETGCLREGDEIYTLNGQSLQGLSHSEAIAAFKKIKQGPVILHIGRRSNKKSPAPTESTTKLESNNSKSCSTLDNI